MSRVNAEWHISWLCAPLASSEHATLVQGSDGYQLSGVVVAPLADSPCHIEYSVIVDPQWFPRRVFATIISSANCRVIELQSREAGGWEVDGVWVPALDNCVDVDLGWTPATNTIPVRRLALEAGESRTITAAWIRFPELVIECNAQTYTKLANDRWRYTSGEYDFELVVDERTGLVLAYGDELWRATAFAVAAT